MDQQRVVCFVDGFNLYHAINRIGDQCLKWVDLWALSSVFVRPKSQQLVDVFYFSAYPDWLLQSKKRHVQYVKAITAFGVKPVLGKFKFKDRRCPDCGHKWHGHEEKETDVNIALAMLNLAYQDRYDHAFLISNDSDLAPAIRMVRRHFPEKRITTIVPPHYFHSNELIQASSEKAKISVDHLKRCLLPPIVYDAGGNIVVSCPKEYLVQASPF